MTPTPFYRVTESLEFSASQGSALVLSCTGLSLPRFSPVSSRGKTAFSGTAVGDGTSAGNEGVPEPSKSGNTDLPNRVSRNRKKIAPRRVIFPSLRQTQTTSRILDPESISATNSPRPVKAVLDIPSLPDLSLPPPANIGGDEDSSSSFRRVQSSTTLKALQLSLRRDEDDQSRFLQSLNLERPEPAKWKPSKEFLESFGKVQKAAAKKRPTRRSVLGVAPNTPPSSPPQPPKSIKTLHSIPKSTETLHSILRNRSRLQAVDISKTVLGKPPPLVPLQEDEDNCSHSTASRGSSVSFDPRVWIREFYRTDEEISQTWFTQEDLEDFRMNAVARVLTYTELVPTGTGRMIQRRVLQSNKLLSFSNKALGLEEDDDDAVELRVARIRQSEKELKNILVVDPLDICLRLFAKALKNAMPYVNVVLAHSAREGVSRLAEKAYDMLIVDERLTVCSKPEDHSMSGSAFLERLPDYVKRRALLVGVSAYLKEDKEKLSQGGADICWPKPPPTMDGAWRDSILKALLEKRGKTEEVAELFDCI